jgi:hypothetical protein
MSLTAGVTYTFSFYFKNGTVSNPYGQGVNSGPSILVTTFTPTFQELGQSLNTNIDVGNGWYRQVYTFTPSYTQTYQVDFNQSVNQSPIGTYYLYGFQLEIGSSVTDYYATTSTAKNRGTILSDLSGNGNTGTLTNGVGYGNSNSGSFVFDGVDDYTTFSSTSLNLYPITLSFWATPTGEVINKYVASSVNGYRVSFGTGGISGYYFKSGSDYTLNYDNSYGSGTLGVFSYGTMTVDATGVKFYINGQLVGSNSWTGTAGPPTTAESLKFGLYPGPGANFYRSGNISQASIYNKALTAAEVRQNFNALRGRFGI